MRVEEKDSEKYVHCMLHCRLQVAFKNKPQNSCSASKLAPSLLCSMLLCSNSLSLAVAWFYFINNQLSRQHGESASGNHRLPSNSEVRLPHYVSSKPFSAFVIEVG
jgi:hypothetical protein